MATGMEAFGSGLWGRAREMEAGQGSLRGWICGGPLSLADLKVLLLSCPSNSPPAHQEGM